MHEVFLEAFYLAAPFETGFLHAAHDGRILAERAPGARLPGAPLDEPAGRPEFITAVMRRYLSGPPAEPYGLLKPVRLPLSSADLVWPGR